MIPDSMEEDVSDSQESDEYELKDSKEFPAPLELRFHDEPQNDLQENFQDIIDTLSDGQTLVVTQNGQFQVVCKHDHDCEFGCEVIDGKSTCTCPPDYELAYDGKSCCAAETEKEFKRRDEVVCQKGYMMNDLDKCVDVNECLIENNACSDGYKCVNTQGSFTCVPSNVCRKGYHFNWDTLTCHGELFSQFL